MGRFAEDDKAGRPEATAEDAGAKMLLIALASWEPMGRIIDGDELPELLTAPDVTTLPATLKAIELPP